MFAETIAAGQSLFSPATRIMQELDVHNTAELVLHVVRRGVIS